MKMDDFKGLCSLKNLLAGFFLLGVCTVLGERLENEDVLQTGMHYQVANSTSIPQVHEGVSNVSHYIPDIPVAVTHPPESTDIQVSALTRDLDVQSSLEVESEYRNDSQDVQNSSQTQREINNDSFEINTSFSVSDLKYQGNTTTATGKMGKTDFINHSVESVSYDSVETSYNTETPSTATTLLTEFVNSSFNITSTNHIRTDIHKTVVHMNDTQVSEVHDAAHDFTDFAGIGENNGHHTSASISVSHLLTSTIEEGTTLASDHSYVATTKVDDEVTISNEVNPVEYYATLLEPAAPGESDEITENLLGITSTADEGVSSEALTKTTTNSETIQMNTNLASQTESMASLEYETLQASNWNGSENLWRVEEDIHGNTTTVKQDDRNCESQHGCEGENVEHANETITQVHGTSSGEEESYKEIDFVGTTEIYTVVSLLVEVSSINHSDRSTSVTSVIGTEPPSSPVTVNVGTDDETVSSVVPTSPDAEVQGFHDDREHRTPNTSSGIRSNISRDTARYEFLSQAPQLDESAVTENGNWEEQTTSFVDAQPSELNSLSFSVDIHPALSTGIFMHEQNAHKNSLSTTNIFLADAMHQGIDYTSHTLPFTTIYLGTFDRDFGDDTTAAKAQTTAYEINETVSELSMQEESSTETSAEQNTRTAEFYDMAVSHDSGNEQNNFIAPYSASISYKLTSESSSSLKSSFDEYISTQASTREIDISHQISTQLFLPSALEVSISSSLPELATESAVLIHHLGQKSEPAFSKYIDGTTDSMIAPDKHPHAIDSDITSLIYNQSSTPNQQNSFVESFSTEISTDEKDIAFQISTQSPLPSASEILHLSRHFNVPESSMETTDHPFNYSSQESEQVLSQYSENTRLDMHSQVTDSNIIPLSSKQSLQSRNLRNSFDEYLPSESSTEEMNISLQISTQSSLPSTSEVLLSSSYVSLPELPMKNGDHFEYLSDGLDQTFSQSTQNILLESHSYITDPEIVSWANKQSLRFTNTHNSVLKEAITESLEESISSEARMQASSGSEISSFSIKQATTLLTFSGTSPTEETIISLVGSSEGSMFSDASLSSLATEEPQETISFVGSSEGSIFSEASTNSLTTEEPQETVSSVGSTEGNIFSETSSLTTEEPQETIPSVRSSEGSMFSETSTSSLTIGEPQETIVSFVGSSEGSIFSEASTSSLTTEEPQETTISSIPSSERSIFAEANTSSLTTTVEHYEFSETEILSPPQKDKIPTSSSVPREMATPTVPVPYSDINFSFLLSEERDHSAVTEHMSYTESDGIITSTHLKEHSEISEDSLSEFSLNDSRNTADYISFTNVSGVTPSAQMTKHIHYSLNQSTFNPQQRSVWSTVESIIYTASDFPISSTNPQENTNATSSLIYRETMLPRSSDTSTSAVSLTTDDTIANVTKSIEDHQKGKESSTFTQDYSSASIHASREFGSTVISTTEQSTHKYTQEFLTTQYKMQIIQKAFQSITIEEMSNTITVVFRITQDTEWIDLYTKRFSEWMVNMLLSEIKEHKMKSSSSDVSNFQGKSSGNLTRVELIYVLPSPYTVSEDLIFTFFALIVPYNDTIPMSKVIDALLSDTEGMQNYMHLNLSYFIRGQYLMPSEMDNWPALDHVWQKHGTLLLIISILTLLIVVILIAAVIYLRCKSRRSVAYISEKDRLHHDLHGSTEIGDLNRGSVILQDEIYEKDPSLVNGNHVVTIGDDEGWLVPINDVPVEDLDAPDVQDTKL